MEHLRVVLTAELTSLASEPENTSDLKLLRFPLQTKKPATMKQCQYCHYIYFTPTLECCPISYLFGMS